MKPAAFDYHCPATTAEALELLSALEDARPLAGGQTLVPMLNLRIAAPANLVDLGNIPELRGISEIEGGFHVGAMTSQRELERSTIVGRLCPLMYEALEHVGHQQTRNRGTIGGSLCHLDPVAELSVVATALDATLTIANRERVRTLPFSKFPSGYLTSDVASDELLIGVKFPAMKEGVRWAFEEFARRHADFAVVAVAVILRCDGDILAEVNITIAGLSAAPFRAMEAESILQGSRLEDADRLNCALKIIAAHHSDGDWDNPPEYRQHLAAVLTRRALFKAFARPGASDE